MTPDEHIATRRATIADGVACRQVPTALVTRRVPLAPLAELVDELNAPGQLLPGLRAEVDHLVLRAAARALDRHPHLRNLFVQGQAGHQVNQVTASLHVDGPGSAAFGLIDDPGSGPLAARVQEMDATAQDGRLRRSDEVRQLLRMHRSRPLKEWLLVDGLGESLAWLRDRARLPAAWVQAAVQQTGNLAAHLLGQLGLRSASPTLTGPRLVQVVVTTPELHLAADGERVEGVVRIGVAFDQRLFEPWEAAAYLDDITQQLAEPRERLA